MRKWRERRGRGLLIKGVEGKRKGTKKVRGIRPKSR